MGAFPDLRSLAIRVVRDEFDAFLKRASKSAPIEAGGDSAVLITIRQSLSSECDEEYILVALPLALLQSASVMLSIWRDEESVDSANASGDKEDRVAVEELVRMLMRHPEHEKDNDDGEAEYLDGLASARYSGSGKNAIPVESVSFIKESFATFCLVISN